MERSKTGTANGTSRRDVLKLVGAGAPVALAAAAIGGTPAAAAAPDGSGAGLRKTEHVKKYLESARF